MYLTHDQSQQLATLFACLSEDWREAQLRTYVGETLLRLLKADQFASFTWNPVAKQFGDEVFINMSPANIKAYEQHYQFCDPITPTLQRQRTPTLVSQILPQTELVKTEFFNDFLRQDGLYHGINAYLWDDNLNIGDFRIWRSQSRAAFDSNDQQLLAHIQPALTSAICRIRRHQSMLTPSRLDPVPNQTKRRVLGGRRAGVAQYVADGLSDKEIARQLDMAYNTVRTHVAHLFRSFDANNRTHLARLLADAP